MKQWNRLMNGKYWLIAVLLLFMAIAWVSSLFHYRIDLTTEKRYTFSKSTVKLLKQLNQPVKIDVYLTGELTAGLKKVQNNVNETLNEYRDYANGNIAVRYIDVFKMDEDSAQAYLLDSLRRFGLQPLTQVAQEKKGAEQTQRLVIPGAVISSVNGSYPVNFLQGVSNSDESSYYNSVESLLEYKLSAAIEKVTRTSVPRIAFLTGNGEPLMNGAFELITTLAAENVLDTLHLQSVPFIAPEYNAVIILQPSASFSEADKLKIDQYILHGGSVLFAADVLDAPLDSLSIKGSALAFDKGLNITDLLFKYGVRINPNLVQDYQATDIPQVVGDVGGKPQIQMLKWPYYPLVSGTEHPVSKNLDPVFIKYASSVDTVKTPGAEKHLLLTTSKTGKIIASPTIISFNAMQYADDPNAFKDAYIPVSVLVEGSFNSLFANRLPQAVADSFRTLNYSFEKTSVKPGKLIVISDGDAFLNEFTQKGKPVPMGMNQYVQYTFANKQFLLNCIDYLAGQSGIFESRSKNFTLRLLDAEKVETGRQQWQLINIGLPLLFIAAFGMIFLYLRKRKYAHK